MNRRETIIKKIQAMKEYILTYNMNGGSLQNGVLNPSVYSYETKSFILNNPSLDGYTFAGWTENDDEELKGVVLIPIGSFGDKEFTAIFTEHQSSFDLSRLYMGGSPVGNGVELTKNGCNNNGEYLTQVLQRGSNLLYILFMHSLGESHTLDITVPSGLYIVDNSWTTPSSKNELDTATFTTLYDENGGIGGQFTGSYSNPQTGTLSYTTKSYAGSTETVIEEIMLMVAFDRNIWNKGVGIQTGGLTGGNNAVMIKTRLGNDIKNSVFLKEVTTTDTLPCDMSSYPIKSSIKNSENLQSVSYTNFGSNAENLRYILKDITSDYDIKVVRNGNVCSDIKIPLHGIANYDGDPDSFILTENEDGTYTTYVSDVCSLLGSGLRIGTPQLLINNPMLQENDYISIRLKTKLKGWLNQESNFSSNVNLVYTGSTRFMVYRINKTVADSSYYQHGNKVAMLGNLAMGNGGTVDSDSIDINIEFNTEDESANAFLWVKGYHLPLPHGQSSLVTIKWIDKNGAITETTELYTCTTGTSKNGNFVHIAAPEDKYFHSLNYTIDSVPENTYLYHGSASLSPISSGIILGTIEGDAGSYAISKITAIHDNIEYTTTAKTTVANPDTYKISNYLSLNTTSSILTCIAGEQLNIYLTVSCCGYPYTDTEDRIASPVLYFIAPQGITINSVIWNDDNIVPDDKIVVEKIIDSGDVVYKINFGTEAGFGGYSISSGQIIANDKMKIQLILNTSEDMTYSSYELNSRLLLANQNTESSVSLSGTGGSWNDVNHADIYDVNNNENTEEYFVGLSNNNIKNIVVYNADWANVY